MAIKEYIELSKIINIENGITKLPKNYKINGKYEFLDYKTVYKRESINDNFEFQKINIFNKNLNMYKNNYWNLIFTWSSETNNDIFYGTYINTHKKFIVNGFCKILKVIDTSYSPKWLCWYINYSKNVQAVRESILYTTRCNMKKKYLDDIKIPKINIFAQQQIIDIIEPKEKLFLKYHNIVDISNIDNFKKTWSILIDIIEPFEKIREKYIKVNKKIIKIFDLHFKKYNMKNNYIKLKDFCLSINVGSTPSTKNPENWNGNIYWINSGILTDNYVQMDFSKKITNIGKDSKKLKLSNIGSIFISILEPSINKISICGHSTCYNQSIANLDSQYNGYLFFIIRNLINQIKSLESGTAQQSINKTNLENFKIPLPNKNDNEYNQVINLIINLNYKIKVIDKIIKKLIDLYII